LRKIGKNALKKALFPAAEVIFTHGKNNLKHPRKGNVFVKRLYLNRRDTKHDKSGERILVPGKTKETRMESM